MSAAPKPHGRVSKGHAGGRVRSDTIRRSAEGRDCTLRLPRVCNFDPSTTVLAHLPGHSRGTGLKVSDIHAVYACHACHLTIDTHSWGRAGLSVADVLDAMLRALDETHLIMIEAGLLMIKGDGK